MNRGRPKYPTVNTTQVASGITSVFKDARAQVEQDTIKIIRSLNSKKAEMFAEIDRLEREFVDSYEHKQTELIKLKALQTQTGQLSENILSTMQHAIAKELEQGIQNLHSEIEDSKVPLYNIDINWGLCILTLLNQIKQSNITISPKAPEYLDPLIPPVQQSIPSIHNIVDELYYKIEPPPP